MYREVAGFFLHDQWITFGKRLLWYSKSKQCKKTVGKSTSKTVGVGR